VISASVRFAGPDVPSSTANKQAGEQQSVPAPTPTPVPGMGNDTLNESSIPQVPPGNGTTGNGTMGNGTMGNGIRTSSPSLPSPTTPQLPQGGVDTLPPGNGTQGGPGEGMGQPGNGTDPGPVPNGTNGTVNPNFGPGGNFSRPMQPARNSSLLRVDSQGAGQGGSSSSAVGGAGETSSQGESLLAQAVAVPFRVVNPIQLGKSAVIFFDFVTPTVSSG
jgi:hypothetical protein